MSTVPRWLALVREHGSDVGFHRDGSEIPCPCLTPEGSRDLEWHLIHQLDVPAPPMCNAAGMIPDVTTTQDYIVKAFVQPVQSGAVRRLTGEQLDVIFGEVESDDHLGLFPVEWDGHRLEFTEWSSSTKDYITYHGRRFTVVSVNLIPDPADGNPEHHWEVGLRLISG
jgi:hypothetical protein